jgi:hypothetical protein
MTEDALVEPSAPLVQSSVEGAQLAIASAIKLQPGTVMAYSETPPDVVTVKPDNGETQVPARSLLNRPLSPSTRVMLAWDPGGGCLVVGLIGRAPYPSACLVKTADISAAHNINTTVNFTASEIKYIYGGMELVNNLIMVPFTGLYAASARVDWNNEPANSTAGDMLHQRDTWIERIGSDGITLVESTDAWVQTAEFTPANTVRWYETQNPSTAAWPMNAGEFFRLRVKQVRPFGSTIAATVNKVTMSVCWAGMSADDMN